MASLSMIKMVMMVKFSLMYMELSGMERQLVIGEKIAVLQNLHLRLQRILSLYLHIKALNQHGLAATILLYVMNITEQISVPVV